MKHQTGVRRLTVAASAAVAAVTLTVGSANAFVVSDSSSQTGGGASATLTAPSGASASVGGITRLTAPTQGPATSPMATPQVAAAGSVFLDGENYVRVSAYDGANFPEWTDVQAVVPTNDGLFHDWMEYSVTFDHPMVDPVLTVSSAAGSSIVSPGIYEAFAAVQMRIPTVTTAAGATITPALTLENFTPGFTVGAGNTIQAPTGTLPLELASRTSATAPNHDLVQDLVVAAIPGTALQSRTRGAGEVRIDSGGIPIASVRLVAQLTALHLSDAENSGIVATAYPQVSVRWATEVSGWNTPAGYGAATHTITAMRLGTASQEAFATTQLTAPTAGTAGDNSNAGYDALTPAALGAFSSSFSVTDRGSPITLTVPISNVSQEASVRGWLDFNGNGAFDPGEESNLAAVTAGGTQAVLTWTVPQDVAAGDTWLRLRAGFDAGQLASPTGWADSGEVEDYPMTINLAQPTGGLVVDKTVTSVVKAAGNTASDAQAGDTIRYNIAVTNDSSYAMADVTVADALVSELTCTDASDASVTLPADLAAGATIDCVGSHVVTTAEERAGTVRNVATATGQWDDPDVEPGPVTPASGEAQTTTVGTVTPTASPSATTGSSNTAGTAGTNQPVATTASSGLPRTGTDALRILMLAGVVLGLGALAVWGSRVVRRRRG